MESNEALSRLREIPDPPRRHFTAFDLVLIVGAPVLAYGGGVVAAWGNIAGPIIAGAAALMAVAVRAIRLSRTDEPAIAPFTFPLSIAAAVVIFVTAFNLFTNAPHTSAVITFGLPLLGVAVYVIYLLALFWRHRR